MVWDPTKVGCRDDSFKGGGWDPFGYGVDVDQIDGDYVELTVQAGETQGYIEKGEISVDASVYKYLVLGLWGDGDYYVQVYDGSWKNAQAMADAPDTYDIVVIDLSGVTSGTVTGIRLGVGSAAGKKATYDFFEFHSEQPSEPTDVVSMRVLQREGEADRFTSEWIEGATNPFTKGYCIRVIAGRDSNVEKIFAGVIEESNLRADGLREVAGRCFQVKLQAATKTKSLDDRELSLAVKDVVEDFTEITTGRVKTPSPAIYVSKDYVDAHIVDILDQLASLPSKQSPYTAWRWKLGFGQDLRFRSEDDADVRTCSTSIAEGTNLLDGVRKGSDIYELYNKVKAISGLIEWPLDDGWCEAASGWSTYQCTVADETGAGKIRRGTKSIKVTYAGAGPPYQWDIYKTFTAKDLTEFARLVFDLYLGAGWRDAINVFAIRCYSAGGGYFYYTIDDSNNVRDDKVWHHFEIDLDDPNWETSGSPSWEDINEIRIVCVTGSEWTGSYWLDGLHFEADNLERTASDTSSPVDHDRVLVYKDAKINDPDKLQDLADGLLETVKAAADRIMLPVTGEPDLQRGRKVQVTAASFGLSGTYPILEAEHILSRETGYLVLVMIQRGRYNLPADLRRTLERDLRLEKLGTVTIT